MTSDQTVFCFQTALQIRGVNRFYTRRVLQRCERGEITLLEAARLLMAAAENAAATTQVVSVRHWVPDRSLS